jgi:hypothetical protein
MQSLLHKAPIQLDHTPTHGGRPSHDPTVRIQNVIATEHGIPASELLGLIADPHHGESIAKVTVSQFPRVSANPTVLPASERECFYVIRNQKR